MLSTLLRLSAAAALACADRTEKFIAQFDVPREQIRAVLDFVAQSLKATHTRL